MYKQPFIQIQLSNCTNFRVHSCSFAVAKLLRNHSNTLTKMLSLPYQSTFLPISTIQHTLPNVASEIYNALIPSEHVWLSCYRQGESSVHGRVKLSLDESDREKINLEGTGGVKLEKVDEVCILFVSCDSMVWRHSC